MPSDFKAFTNKDFADYDIQVYNYGYRHCTPGFTPGFHYRSHYLLHYVYEGECVVEIEDKSYNVFAGQMFVIFPNLLCNYTSSAENPCTYRWIEVDGRNFENFLKTTPVSRSSPILSDNADGTIANLLSQITDEGKMSWKKLNGYAWFLAEALSSTDSERQSVYEKYIEKAVEYIRFNSEKKTTVSDVASYLQIDRSYLSRVFNEYMGISIKKYIYNYHMDIGKSFLAYSSLSIKEIAAAIGYEDPLDFTKAFHRSFGMSPSKWRQLNSKNSSNLKNSEDKAE
jgi:AraC-like DNA-binding protein